MALADTIAAIATAPGRGGVAVIRVSGPEARAVAERLTGRPPQPGRIAFARLFDRTRQPAAVIDEAVVLTFKAPHSYTGEDVVEFQCHGGTVTPRRVLAACFAAGARLARRGEFTERAFLNGKLDYDQAESVLDLVDAKTVRAADAALEGLSGRKQRLTRELYDRALALSTELEHTLDVDEDELPDGFADELRAKGEDLKTRVAAAIRRLREGKVLREGALVVLSGPPNVGKSSLMNALLEENRAIVSEVAGTTRDSIEEWLDLDGWPIRLVDTAGLRSTGDAIEAEGVRRAKALAASADVLLRLSEAPSSAEPTGRTLDVQTKADLHGAADGRPGVLRVSAKTGEGLDELKRAIVARLEACFGAPTDESSSANDADALERLMAARTALVGAGAADDLVLLANCVRTASTCLGELVGATYSADLLDRLFSRFCVGK